MCKSNESRHREVALIVIENLCEHAIDIVSRDMTDVKPLLMGAMKDNNERVRIGAIKCTVKLLLSLPEPDLQSFKEVVPLLFQNISVATKNVEESHAKKNGNNNDNLTEIFNQVICDACAQLQSLCQNIPEFFADTMKPIVQCLDEVVKSPHLEWCMCFYFFTCIFVLKFGNRGVSFLQTIFYFLFFSAAFFSFFSF